ncbi:TPA: TetR/AcrR family transcriptional regulator, partial [Pseudomonas aeruginosa]
LFREMPDDCFASVVIGPAHDLARQWLAGRTRVALADCRELLAQVAWDSVRAA